MTATVHDIEDHRSKLIARMQRTLPAPIWGLVEDGRVILQAGGSRIELSAAQAETIGRALLTLAASARAEGSDDGSR